MPGMRRMKLEGLRFGRLTVVEFAYARNSNSHWRCRCDCGAEVVVAGCHLKQGHTTSCGCFHRERVGDLHRTHGQSNAGGRRNTTPTYRTWRAMMRRCNEPTNNRFHLYGGRGIRVCDRWASFDAFFADMGERPARHTIDRINNDGNYEPGNCRWATNSEQRLNQRRQISRSC